MNLASRLLRSLPLFFLVFAGCLSLHAGTVRGAVKDQIGAVVPHATVRLLAGSTVVATASTDAEGRYQLDSAQAGRFHLQTSAATFASADSDSFYVGKTDSKNEDVTLHAPNVVQQVVVTATGTPTPQSRVGASVSVLNLSDYQERLN